MIEDFMKKKNKTNKICANLFGSLLAITYSCGHVARFIKNNLIVYIVSSTDGISNRLFL